jgi:predicted nucleic acid-binding protein
MNWLASVDEEQLFLSIISLAELRHGIERLEGGRRKSALDFWLSRALPARFDNRLLQVDVGVADQWGHIVAHAQAAGRPIGAMDAFLAATAQQHQLTLVTRNVSNFEVTGIRLFNPWTEGNKA